ncbi:MAG TPA: class I SAM-dependent methyltransferase [bacterium]|nr:class I SAM-dependent methyltransferase [bacterium]
MRERDIRPQQVFDEFLRLSRLDARQLAAQQEHWRHCACPACGAKQSLPGFSKHGFSYVTCARCASLYADPRPTRAALAEFYRDSRAARFLTGTFYRETEQQRRMLMFRPRARLLAQLLRQHGVRRITRLADIGAGYGVFLQEMRRTRLAGSYTAIEPSLSAGAVLRDKKFKVIQAMLEAVPRNEYGRYDLLTMCELFEHLHAPAPFLRKVRRLLRPHGCLFLTTLSGAGFDIRVLGRDARAVHPPHHLNFVTPDAMAILLRRCGFESLAIITPGKLDTDIVANAPAAVQRRLPPFLRELLANETARTALQQFLVANRMSSHMVVLARRK